MFFCKATEFFIVFPDDILMKLRVEEKYGLDFIILTIDFLPLLLP